MFTLQEFSYLLCVDGSSCIDSYWHVQAVCVILDVKPAKAKDEAGKPINDYWKPSVALLNEKDFLNKLKSYDKDNINPKLIDKIRTSYLTNEGFTPENAKKASPAAEGMCKWVHAMSSYEKVSCAAERQAAWSQRPQHAVHMSASQHHV